MGLLDGNLLGGIDPTDPRVALAAGLLGGRGNFGANLGQGLMGAQQSAQAKNQFALVQQNAERANRANDLQQINGLYQTMQTQDMIQAIQDRKAGVPHIPNPALATLQAKMQELAGLPPLSAGAQASSVAPSSAPAAPPRPSAFQYGASPNLQPAQGVPAGPAAQFQGVQPPQAPQSQPQGLLRSPQSAPPSQSPQDPFADQRDEGDLYALLARKPELLAENRYKLSLPVMSRGVSFNPATGRPIYGMVDNVPVSFDAQGNPTVVPNQIGGAIAERQGAVTSATEGAKAPYTFHNVTTASGATIPMSTAQLMNGGVRGPQLPPTGPQIPAPVQAAANRGQVSGANPGQQQPAQAPSDPWATMPKMAQPQGIGVGNYAAGVQKAQAETVNRLSEKLGQKADAAQFRIATGQQALEVLDRADTGTGGALLGDVKTFLTTRAGIPESDFSNDPAATTALNKDLMTAAVAKAKSMYGARMTQNEVNAMLKRGAPNGDMVKSAIRFLVQSDMATAGYDVQQANDFGEYIGRNGDPMRFEGWYGKNFPLSKVLQGIQLAPNTPENAQASGYGWSVKRVQ